MCNTTSPYSFFWDTNLTEDEQHMIDCIAWDAASQAEYDLADT